MADLTQQITDAASGPKEYSIDGEKAVEHSLQDLIAADKYLKSKTASSLGSFGLRFAKIVPGSAAGTPGRS